MRENTSIVSGAAYLAALIGSGVLAVSSPKIIDAHDGLLQIVVLRLMIGVLMGTFAALAALYIGCWKFAGRSSLGGSVLKLLVFPFVLCHTAFALNSPGATSLGLMAVLFVLSANVLGILERGVLNVMAVRARNHANELFANGRPTRSDQLYALDVFALLLPALLLLPRLVA
ncbi:MAG: hypothetical protein ACM3SS_09190 [Rhodospirillaceae bacterium]